eukprot:scaffold5540_cov390-Prasinococcus_capsulatus_cf.AAC.8
MRLVSLRCGIAVRFYPGDRGQHKRCREGHRGGREELVYDSLRQPKDLGWFQPLLIVNTGAVRHQARPQTQGVAVGADWGVCRHAKACAASSSQF